LRHTIGKTVPRFFLVKGNTDPRTLVAGENQ
jgi:hypothetical protein